MNKVVTNDEWISARKQLLQKEKELDKQRDELSRLRRELPWEKVEKKYVFQGPGGSESLAELFGDRSQLIVYHFMILPPEWKVGCPGCSFMVDNFPADRTHLERKDLKLVVVSRAPLDKIEAFKKRMGWNFKWVSSFGTSFNYDYQVSHKPDELATGKAYYNYGTTEADEEEQPGLSIFAKDEKGQVYHTYSTYARGLDMLVGTYHYLDLTPKGRDEKAAMDWVKRHDEYSD